MSRDSSKDDDTTVHMLEESPLPSFKILSSGQRNASREKKNKKGLKSLQMNKIADCSPIK